MDAAMATTTKADAATMTTNMTPMMANVATMTMSKANAAKAKRAMGAAIATTNNGSLLLNWARWFILLA
jgi:hypothetical protein